MTDRRSPTATLDTLLPRTFVLEQRIRYTYDSPVTDVRQHLRIVPPALHGPQRCDDWQLDVGGAVPARTLTTLDGFGNVTTDIMVPVVDHSVEFTICVRASAEPASGHLIAADPRYLELTALTGPDPSVVALLGSGARPDAATLSGRVHRAIAYEWGITGVRTTAAEALAGGRGVCQDYAHIMLSACRLAGIPARYVSGHLVGEGGSHAWVEVLHPTDRPGIWSVEGWDPTHDRRTGPDYLVVAVGRDYGDCAPLWGTYEGDDVASSLTVTKRLTV